MSESSNVIGAPEAAFARFRESSFFADECLDMLAAAADDPNVQGLTPAIRTRWSEEIEHQLHVLGEMSRVLMKWHEPSYVGVPGGEEAGVVADFHDALMQLSDEDLAEEWVLEVARGRDAA